MGHSTVFANIEQLRLSACEPYSGHKKTSSGQKPLEVFQLT